MNSGKTIFAQLMDFVPAYEFRKCVERYNGNHKVISFSCWDQFLCMAFAQLTYRESLRDIQVCLRAAQSRLYHLGIRGKVSRNTLAHANQTRDWRIYADFAQILIQKARKLYAADSFGIELDQAVYRLGFYDHRPLPGSFPLGQVPETQGGNQAPYSSGSAWEYSFRRDHHHGKSPRCQHPRPTAHRAWGHLYHGSRLSGFCPPLQYPPGVGILCHSGKKKLQPNTPLLPTRRQIHRRPMRSDCRPQGSLCEKGLPGKTPTHPLLRFKEQQNVCIPDQQLRPAGHHDCRSLSLPLAGGAVFQMDQAASQDQGLLWHHRECSQDPDLDRHLGLCSRGHREEDLEIGPKSLHNSTDFERDPFRKRTNLSSTFKCQLHKPGGQSQQPIESIRLTLGQQ